MGSRTIARDGSGWKLTEMLAALAKPCWQAKKAMASYQAHIIITCKLFERGDECTAGSAEAGLDVQTVYEWDSLLQVVHLETSSAIGCKDRTLLRGVSGRASLCIRIYSHGSRSLERKITAAVYSWDGMDGCMKQAFVVSCQSRELPEGIGTTGATTAVPSVIR